MFLVEPDRLRQDPGARNETCTGCSSRLDPVRAVRASRGVAILVARRDPRGPDLERGGGQLAQEYCVAQ